MRRRAFVLSLIVWTAIALAVWLDASRPLVTAPYTGAWFQFIIAGIVAALSHIASAAVTIAVTVAQAAWMVAVAVARFSVQVAHVFIKVGGVLADFWRSALRPLVSFIGRAIERLSAWLRNALGPVIQFVERIRQHVQRIYEQYLRPILDAIDVTRRILQILAQLHVPFARAIDAKLAELEDRLLAPIRFAMQKLNEALNWINRIVTLDGLLQRVTLIRSLIEHAAESWAVLIGKQTEDLDTAATARMRARAYPAATATEIARPLEQYILSGTGADAEAADDLARLWQDSLAEGQRQGA